VALRESVHDPKEMRLYADKAAGSAADELAVQQVLARYSRAHDRRDGAAMEALFTPEARVTIGELVGREAIAQATTHLMKPHPPRGWSHNATDGLLIDIDGDCATVDAQFMVFTILGDAKPASGWPAGATGAMGAMGTIRPIESGYYTQKLVRVTACEQILGASLERLGSRHGSVRGEAAFSEPGGTDNT
jgi:hypothetical protein